MIRPATQADFAAIDAFDIFQGDRRREIAERRCLVFEAEGQAAGYVSWTWAGFVGRDYVTQLCVAEGVRRQGIGAALLNAAEKAAGGGRLFVSTEANNAAMLALLAQGGWTAAGCVAGVNRDGEAECFFWKDL